MQSAVIQIDTPRYARCIEVSKRVRWDIDRDVIRGREFNFTQKFLPDGLSQVDQLPFLEARDRIYFSQVQGRTYANMFGLVERFIGVKMLEVSRDHWLGDQKALEALVRFSDEELKHQELFRRLESMVAEGMPAGYAFIPQPNAVAAVVLEKSTWAVLGLACLIELFTLAHYRSSIEPDSLLSDLWKDVFLNHWKEESQHAILDEMEWIRVESMLTASQLDQGVTDLIDLVGAVDGILQMQATSDADYFLSACRGKLAPAQKRAVQDTFLSAYRWQYIGTGINNERFQLILRSMINGSQAARIATALGPIIG